MTKTETVVLGTIRGRHEMPVDDYIFDTAIVDPTDVVGIKNHVWDVLTDKIGVKKAYGQAVNGENSNITIPVWKGEKALRLYVTGLTIVTTTVIHFCALNGVQLELMHYDVSTGKYYSQYMF